MTIQFMEPFRRAWARITAALFKPFDIRKWFVVGFNAFLCGLMEVSNGSGGVKGHEDADLRKFFSFPQTAWDWLQSINETHQPQVERGIAGRAEVKKPSRLGAIPSRLSWPFIPALPNGAFWLFHVIFLPRP